ncbi:hypothetical protein LV78_008005 [Actinosynnema pretiosum]|uniref:hypothetical protein n=1 Tax=Actinosynnema pretiosum TaxID=42197 RepID=UPI0020A29D99|nr:hypothetical protein [Actinosynnema pretiosum]MCP2100000.1 hypothetical protein [Actinosynnema pretiosum]
MTERLTALFVPPSGRPPIPLQTIVPSPALAPGEELLLATAAIDHSGRIPARRLLRALSWKPGDTTGAQLLRDAIALSLDPRSPHRIDTRDHVFVPLGLRDLTGIRTGDHVALFAAPRQRLLLVCPMRILHSLITEHWKLPGAAGEPRP